jgi:hypothetical protein
MRLDAFHGDVDTCTTVTVVLMPTGFALEPLFVTVRTLRMTAQRTPLTRVLRVTNRSNQQAEYTLT